MLPQQIQPLQPIPSPSPHPLIYHPQIDTFISTVTEKLEKLDILDDILSRLVAMENNFKRIDNEICEIKQNMKSNNETKNKMDKGIHGAYQ